MMAKVEDVKHGFIGGIIGVAGTLVSQLDDTRDIVCWCMHVVAFLLPMLVRVLSDWERKKGASVQSDGTTGKRRARVCLSGVSVSGLAFPLFFPRSCGCCIAHT